MSGDSRLTEGVAFELKELAADCVDIATDAWRERFRLDDEVAIGLLAQTLLEHRLIVRRSSEEIKQAP